MIENGKAVADTMENGNGPWLPSACDHKVEVALTPGKHVSAVRFISGMEDSATIDIPPDSQKGN